MKMNSDPEVAAMKCHGSGLALEKRCIFNEPLVSGNHFPRCSYVQNTEAFGRLSDFLRESGFLAQFAQRNLDIISTSRSNDVLMGFRRFYAIFRTPSIWTMSARLTATFFEPSMANSCWSSKAQRAVPIRLDRFGPYASCLRARVQNNDNDNDNDNTPATTTHQQQKQHTSNNNTPATTTHQQQQQLSNNNNNNSATTTTTTQQQQPQETTTRDNHKRQPQETTTRDNHKKVQVGSWHLPEGTGGLVAPIGIVVAGEVGEGNNKQQTQKNSLPLPAPSRVCGWVGGVGGGGECGERKVRGALGMVADRREGGERWWVRG